MKSRENLGWPVSSQSATRSSDSPESVPVPLSRGHWDENKTLECIWPLIKIALSIKDPTASQQVCSEFLSWLQSLCCNLSFQVKVPHRWPFLALFQKSTPNKVSASDREQKAQKKNFLKVLATGTWPSEISIGIAPLIARGNKSKGCVSSGELKSVFLFLTWTVQGPEITCQSSASEKNCWNSPETCDFLALLRFYLMSAVLCW